MTSTTTNLNVLHDEEVTFKSPATKRRKFSKLHRELVLTDKQVVVANKRGSIKESIRLSTENLQIIQRSPREIEMKTDDGKNMVLEVPNASSWVRALGRAIDQVEERKLQELEGLCVRKSREITDALTQYNRRSRELKRHSLTSVSHQYTLLTTLTVNSCAETRGQHALQEKKMLDRYFKKKHKKRNQACSIM